MKSISRTLAAFLLPLLIGCSGTTEPGISAEAAGRYLLMAVNGDALPAPGPKGAQQGELILTIDGIAVRRVVYATGYPDLTETSVAVGSYRLQGSTLDLRLREANGTAESLWSPAATYDRGTITLSHPDPADGPDIEEVYILEANILFAR